MKLFKLSALSNITIATAMMVSVCATTWGLSQQSWPDVLPFALGEAFRGYVAFLLSMFLLVMLGAKISHQGPIITGVAIAALIAILSGALWPLAVLLWFALASILFGRVILAFLSVGKASADLTTCFLVGAGIYGTAVGLLAHAPLNYPGVYGLALAAPLLLGWRQLPEMARQVKAWLDASQDMRYRIDWLSVAIAAIALVHFVVTLMPEVQFDALTLHLLVPSHLALRHQWGFDPSLYAMALIPMLGDWLFSIGYMLAGETGARLINLAFTYLLAWQAREVVLWAGGNEGGAKWAALLFLATPLTFLETSSLFVDSVFSAFTVAGTMAILRLISTPQEKRGAELIIGGLTLGLAAAAKAVTLNILPVLMIPLLLRWRYWANRHLAPAVMLGFVLFLSVGGISYVTAWLIAGNPFHPFFNGIFKSPYYPPINFDNPLFKSGAGLDLPYNVIFNSGKYLEATNGASGFQWLLLLPVTLVILIFQGRSRALLLFAIAVLSVALIFYSQSYLRYAYPASLLLSAVIGVSLSPTSAHTRLLMRIFSLVAGLALALNLLFFSAAGWTYRELPLKILLGDPFRSQYLETRLPVRSAVEFINYLNVERSPVAFFSQPFGAGLNADALYPNWYNHRFKEGIEKARDAHDVIRLLSQYGSRFVLLDEEWGTPERRKIIEQPTERIAEFGSVSVRSVRDEYLFSKELINNSELAGSEGWALGNGVLVDPKLGTFLVTVSDTATQVVKVRGGTRFINEVTARCGKTQSQGRIQINWHDAQMAFITTSIRVFDCSADWLEHRQIVIAPKNAAFAIVYGSSHTSVPIEITRISMR